MAPNRVVFSRRADRRLNELYDYISDQSSPAIAIGYIRRIRAACLALADFPERGHPRNDIAPGLRIVTMERRVTIVYRAEAAQVRIVTIAYAGRNFLRELRHRT
jgi:toxin ParE1/3/4